MKALALFLLLVTAAVTYGQSSKNLSQFAELPEAPNAADWIYLWDSSASISKKLSPANLFKAMPVAGLTEVGGVKRNVGGAGEFVAGIDSSGNLVYGTPAGSGGGISITGARVPYGNGSGSLTSEAGFEYSALTNTLSVASTKLSSGVLFGTDNISLSSPTPGVFYISEGTLTGDELAIDLSSDNAIRLFSGTGVGTVQFDGIDVIVPAEIYDSGTWNGSNEVPTKDAIRDKIESFDYASQSAANTFTQQQAWTAANRSTPTPMGALVVDLTKALNTKTVSANSTITFSGVLADGAYSELRIFNTGASAVTIDWAVDMYDGNSGDGVSSFTIPAASAGNPGRRRVLIESDGTDYLFYQGGSGEGGFPNPATEDLNMGANNITNAANVTATTFTGSGANLTNLSAPELSGTVPALTYEQITTARSIVRTPTAAVGNVIVTGDAWTVVTADSASETVTYSSTPLAGTGFRWTPKAHNVPTTFNIPTTFSLGTDSNRTSFVVPANKFAIVDVVYDGTAYVMSGENVYISDLPAHASPTTSYLVETGDPTTGASGKSTIAEIIAGTSIKTTRTGVRRTIYVNAGAMIPRTTNGAAAATVETGTNDIMYDCKDFDQTTEEGVGFWLTMPPTWNEGTLTAKFHWTASGGTPSETVAWNIAARGYQDSAAIDAALGTEQASSDALVSTGGLHISATTSALTVGGDADAGNPVYFQITRDVAADDLAADARLLGITIEYTESSTEPSAQ